MIKVDTYEGGLKYSTPMLSAYLTVFHNEFSGLQNSVITNGQPVFSLGGARTTGAELEGMVRPIGGLSIGFAGTWLDAKYKNYRDSNGAPLDGNKVQRQPRWQWRVTPSYEARFGNDNKATVFTTIAFIGDRFSDVQNQQLLPKYYKWDAGLQVELGKRLEFQVSVDNITNTIGLTEGNPRTIGSQGSGAILARPILGRSALFSAAVKF